MSTFVGDSDILTSDWALDVEPAEVGPSMIRVTDKKDASQTRSFASHFVRGIAYPPFCSEKRWEALNDRIQYRNGDVIVVSYPKCGTTWAEQAVLLLLNRGNTSLLNPAAKNVYVPGTSFVGKIWPEACIDQNPVFVSRGEEFAPISFADFDEAPSPRVIKTHAPIQTVLGLSGGGAEKLVEGAKLVVVTRNPLDACVSSYYHAWNPSKSGWPFSAWAAAWFAGYTPHGDWYAWNKDWHAHAQAHPDRVCWIQFEDLKKNPEETVQKLADFLGVGGDADLVRTTVRESSFDSMKEQASQAGGDTLGHLRKGVSGDWRNHFNEGLAQEFKDRFYANCAGTGLVFSLGPGEDDLVAP